MNIALIIAPCPREGLPGLHVVTREGDPCMMAEFLPKHPDSERDVLRSAGEALISVSRLGIVNPWPLAEGGPT